MTVCYSSEKLNNVQRIDYERARARIRPVQSLRPGVASLHAGGEGCVDGEKEECPTFEPVAK